MNKEHIIEVIGDSYSLDILESILGMDGYGFNTIEQLENKKWKATIKI